MHDLRINIQSQIEVNSKMKERESRQRVIKRIIRSGRIENQEILANRIEEEGIVVTQATLSRDLNHLRVAKISDGSGGYYYALPGEDQRREPERSHIDDLLRGWISVAFSSNIAVVKTLAGHADSVAIALDNLSLEGVLGTVAGDDTIVVVLEEGVAEEAILNQLVKKIPELTDEISPNTAVEEP